MQLPSNLLKLAQHEPAGPWLAALPDLLDEVAQKWALQLGEPYAHGSVSLVVPVVRHGENLALKIQWPHDECEFEADALRLWNGDGAVRLVDHDPLRHALLLERCMPGTHLASTPDVDQIGTIIDLLPRLWKPAGAPFLTLAGESGRWAANLTAKWRAAGEPCERYLIDAAAAYIAQLSPSQSGQVLVHQDLHGDNVLAAGPGRWLAIDPKPLVGEREFALSPVIRSFEFGATQAALRNRLDRLTSELSLDRQRAIGWAVAQTIAWSFGSGFAGQHYQTARWLLDCRH